MGEIYGVAQNQSGSAGRVQESPECPLSTYCNTMVASDSRYPPGSQVASSGPPSKIAATCIQRAHKALLASGAVLNQTSRWIRVVEMIVH